ncbi:Fatty-acid amide hydrolase 2 [Aphelenchoides bicaudatus]|nr:Fatty-acid amide hydrolase 2 [Aphelenchoides bicaudatus]
MLANEYEITKPFAAVLAPVLYWSVQIFFKLAHYVYVLINFTKRKEVVPAINKNDPLDQLLLLPAVELARKVWKKEVTSAQVLEVYIRRAELTNKQTNAIAQRNYEFARSRAKQIDEDIQRMDENSEEYKELLNTKPFLGVPLSVKDHIGVKGVKLTIGLPCFANNPPMEDDAELVKRLMNAGAIPFLYSNVPEGVMWMETENTIYGRTYNAYDNRKGVGGSSGGEGALLGAGASVLGVGSDIGGSIRTPAMFNGISGLKPSPNIIPWTGCVPDQFHGYQKEMASLGPLTRFAKDLRPMLKTLVDPEHHERLRLDEPVDINKLRVFYMEGSNSLFASSSFDFDVMEALHKAVSHFQDTHSKSTIRIDLPLIHYALVSSSMPVPNFFTGFNPNEALDGWAELPKYIKGKSEHVLPVITWCIAYDFFAKFNYDTKKMGLNSDGFPTAVQIVATPGNERLIIKAAEELEEAFGGWQMPPGPEQVN